MPNDRTACWTPKIHQLLATPVSLDLGTTNGALYELQSKVDRLAADAALVPALREQVHALEQHAQTTGSTLLELSKRVEFVAGRTDPVAEMARTTATLPAPIEKTHAQVFALDTRIGKLGTDLADHIRESLSKTADEIVVRVGHKTPAATIPDDHCLPLLRALVQAQALALDQEPGQIYKGQRKEYKGWIQEDVAIVGLGRSMQSLARELLASDPSLLERFERAFDRFAEAPAAERVRRYVDMQRLAVDIAARLART